MSNGRIKFLIPSGEYTLHFGMKSAQIFAEKGLSEFLLIEARGEKKADDIKSFAYIIFSGLCNYADIAEKQHPSFEEAYLITEEILMAPAEVQTSIFDTWKDARPTKEMMERLGLSSESEEEKKSLQTG